MNNIHKVVLASLIASAGLFSTIQLPAVELKLDQHRIQWTGSTPVKSHYGLLTPASFKASLSDDGKLEALEVVLDMNSIDVLDLKGESRDKLTGHLRSEDFFLVDTYPTATFVMESYSHGKAHGTLTIRGVSQHAALPVTITGDAARGFQLAGKFTFNRRDFNVSYQDPSLLDLAKDRIISDSIELDIILEVSAR